MVGITTYTRDDAPNQTLSGKSAQFNGGAGGVTYTSEIDDQGVDNIGELSHYSNDDKDYTTHGVSSVLSSSSANAVRLPSETKQSLDSLGADYIDEGETVVAATQNTPDYNTLGVNMFGAISDGYSQEDVVKHMKDKLGLTDQQINQVLAVKDRVGGAVRDGYDLDSIKGYLANNKVEQTQKESNSLVEPEPHDSKWAERQWSQEEKEAEGYFGYTRSSAVEALYGTKEQAERQLDASEFLGKLENFYPDRVYTTEALLGIAGNKQAQQDIAVKSQLSRSKIISEFKRYGIDMGYDDQSGEYFTTDSQGNKVPVTPSFWDSIDTSAFEIAGATAGFAAGVNIGKSFGAWGAAGGGLVGSAVGAAFGSQLDYMRTAFDLQQDIDAQDMFFKATNAAEQNIMFDVLGSSVTKLGKFGFNQLRKAKELVWSGNSELAMKELTKISGVSETQAKELSDGLSALNKDGKAADFGDTAKDVFTTSPSGARVLREVVTGHPEKARAIREEVQTRANNLKSAVKTEGTTSEKLIEGYNEYRTAVKHQYKNVKAEVTNSPRLGNFAADSDKDELLKITKRLDKHAEGNTLSGPKFRLLAEKIRGASEGRTMSDLIDLRQFINEVKYNSKNLGYRDNSTLNKVLSEIDTSIEKGANAIFPDPQRWLGDWKQARFDYAQMKNTEETVLAKTLDKLGDGSKVLNDDQLAESVVNQLTNVGKDSNSVLSRLSPKARANVEEGAIQHLVKKHTGVTADGDEFINWRELNESLTPLKLKTGRASLLKDAINEFANVYRFDPQLARVNSKLGVSKSETTLATSVAGIAQRRLVGNVWNAFMSLIKPSESVKSVSGKRYLLNKTLEAIDNPLNQRTATELVEAANKEGVDVSDIVKKFQQGTAEEAGKLPKVRVKYNNKYKEKVIRADRIAPASLVTKTAKFLGYGGYQGIARAVVDKYLSDQGYVVKESNNGELEVLDNGGGK